MRTALFCLALVALPACSLFHPGKGELSAPAEAYERIEFEGAKATAAERAACTAVGGEVVASGRQQWESCVQIFADADKACAGDGDCLGECRYEGEAELAPDTPVAGTCQVTDARFGCRTAVENGQIAHTLCVD
jgi:hypothetical protein